MREIDDYQQLEKIFRALGSRKRLRLLELLMDKREVSVVEISEKLRMPYKTASRNLLILESAGFIESRPRGHFVCYAIKKRRTHPYNLSLLAVVRHATQRATLGEKALELAKIGIFESQMRAYLKILSQQG